MVQFNFESQPWAAKLDWHEASSDLTVVCRASQQIRCHKAILAAASPFISLLLQELEEQQAAVLVLDEVDAVHLRSLLSLLYYGWADAENTGGLIQLWKQLGVTVVRLAPPSIQVVSESSINVTEDIFMQRRSSEEKEDTLKELEGLALGVSKETRGEEVDVEEELVELIKDAEVEDVEEEVFEELEKGRVFKVKTASSKGEERRGSKRNIGAEEASCTRKRERPDNFLSSKEEALPKEKKRVARNFEEKEEQVRVEQVKRVLGFCPNLPPLGVC